MEDYFFNFPVAYLVKYPTKRQHNGGGVVALNRSLSLSPARLAHDDVHDSDRADDVRFVVHAAGKCANVVVDLHHDGRRGGRR